eukprot:m.233389 g.233389  ORF g.233389 m.233389 type:complete len:186 (+) comp12506_c0_seq1:238-795(+)
MEQSQTIDLSSHQHLHQPLHQHQHLGTSHTSMQAQHHPGMDMGMHSTFYSGYSVTVLIDSWVVETPAAYFGTLLCIFLLSFLWEALRSARPRFEAQARAFIADSQRGLLLDPTATQLCPSLFQGRAAFKLQLLRTALHLVQFTLSYLLMLAAMSFNVGLFLAIITGSTVAFYFFNTDTEPSADCH